MIEHPSITMARLTGHPQLMPGLVGKCASCRMEIYAGDEIVIVDGYLYCDEFHYLESAIKDGHIKKVVAGE